MLISLGQPSAILPVPSLHLSHSSISCDRQVLHEASKAQKQGTDVLDCSTSPSGTFDIADTGRERPVSLSLYTTLCATALHNRSHVLCIRSMSWSRRLSLLIPSRAGRSKLPVSRLTCSLFWGALHGLNGRALELRLNFGIQRRSCTASRGCEPYTSATPAATVTQRLLACSTGLVLGRRRGNCSCLPHCIHHCIHACACPPCHLARPDGCQRGKHSIRSCALALVPRLPCLSDATWLVRLATSCGQPRSLR